MSRVVVAMSGGVDSAVAAALLLEQGHAVTGMMLRLWSEPGREESNRCCTPDAVALARRAAARLEIPFYVVDARDIFRQIVVSDFLEGYSAGRTPNPCLLCNRVIRWEFLLEHALALGAEYMATGHYVRRIQEPAGISLLRAVDRGKDQSYVLHALDQAKLGHALFPVGDYPKTEIRALADTFNLPSARRADSQDLCFLAGEDYREFLRRHAPGAVRPGKITRRDGTLLGEHQGLAFYTIGQRKGLGIASPEPLYVLAKDGRTDTLVVGRVEELGFRSLVAGPMNWISGAAPRVPFRALVKTRYTGREAWAQVTPQEQGSRVQVRFEEPLRDISPGQAAVLYMEERMLGGGLITDFA